MLLLLVAEERLQVLRIEQTEHKGGNCTAGEVGDQKDPVEEVRLTAAVLSG